MQFHMSVIEIYFVTKVASRRHLLNPVFPVPGGVSHTCLIIIIIKKKVLFRTLQINYLDSH